MPNEVKVLHSIYTPNPSCEQNITTLNKGKYFFELWGASGGGTLGGKGAYVSGIILFNEETELYIHVGSKGEDPVDGLHNPNGGCNGGGVGGKSGQSGWKSGGGGGGASDIRIGSDEYDNRIIVAGGGGGACGYRHGDGGAAGRIIGNNSTGKQISLGGGQKDCLTLYQGDDGRDADGVPNYGGQGGGGGGGGYYGGCSYNGTGINTNSGGGGGSSFISGYPGFDYNNLKYVFSYYNLIDGTENLLSPYNEKEQGHYGDGFIRISIFQSIIKCSSFTIKFFYYIFVIIPSNYSP